MPTSTKLRPASEMGWKSTSVEESQAVGALRWKSGYSGTSSESRSNSSPQVASWAAVSVVSRPSASSDWTSS